MKVTYALIGAGILLIALAGFLLVHRGHLADEAYGLERERERLGQTQAPADRERYLRVLERSSRLNTDAHNAGIVSAACGALGMASVSFGIVRLRKPWGGSPGSETQA